MSPTPTKRTAGRPRTPVLSAEQIVDAAFALAKTAGPEGFTMAALARSLSVHPPALYHYFRGKADVVRAMRGRIAELLDVAGFDDASTPLDEAVLRWARSYRDAFAANPAGIALLATTAIDGQTRSVANYETIVARLLREGWRADRAVDALVALESFIIGSALDSLAPADIMSPGDAAPSAPHFSRAEARRAADAAARGIPAADRTFELGVAALVAGLRAMLADGGHDEREGDAASR
ncbi:TetR/AcrR family transcriptional regulator [Agromyces endophyticus]|uniref:TetR/AcrR family transcriptional regulator n=1 Tax=Agromyces sp. H17E-10 TaxID=2932244 RepID=UPI001FD25620|nr:TetR/AcrR family transcriptional regulator [Agromyces sp. H17E-10]UOQ88725.1 TetR/AcrR family transcriptional regulator [Agromyces sp. H17E-10]